MSQTPSGTPARRASGLWHWVAVPVGRWVALGSLLVSSSFVVTGGPAAAGDEVRSGYLEPELSDSVPVTTPGRPEMDRSGTGDNQRHGWEPPEVRWPEPGVAVVDPSVGAALAGAVSVKAAVAGDPSAPGWARFVAPPAPESVRVEVLDRAAAEAAGVDGVLLSVGAVTGSGEVELAVDYSGFAGAYGGSWASRLRLVELPACAVTAPRLTGCRAATAVESRNDTAARRVSARVPVAQGVSVFAVTAAESSEAGDHTATDLQAAGSWTHGGSSGGFSYGYPIRVPPAAGPVPEVSLGYSSQSHDGRTSGTNNQASWVGDGWGYQPGLIERTYVPCAKDMDGGNNDIETGDLCWEGVSPSVTLSLNGIHTSLVRDDDTGTWRTAVDQGWRVEKLGSPASASAATSERWVVTTTDGTRYLFAGEVGSSNSRLTVPVFGNHTGEPCRASQFDDSSCRQAYRWMLDEVVDTSGNMARYFYARESGGYAAVLDPDNRKTYHRAVRLTRIEYGLSEGGSGAETGRVLFTADDRCLGNCWDGSDPKTSSWPDTPWDLTCESAPCSDGPWAPAFFSSKRLVEITTQVRDGGGFRDVDSWRLAHEFLDYGDESQVVLWLTSIRHTGHVGGTESTPAMSFTGWALPNRVDHNGIPAIWRSRLSAITTETGGIVTINYSDPDCGAGDLPASPHTNSRLCYPVWWTPPLMGEPERDWFHKYVVDSVVEQETTATGGDVQTFYDYSTAGGGTSVLWGWDDSEFTDDDHRTYSQWRGYPQVTTRVGDPAEGTQLTTRTRYYRGMDGQRLPGGGERSVQVSDAEGNTVTDHRALAGATWEETSYLGSSIDSATTYRYWTSKTATRTHDSGELEAWLTGVSREDSRQRLAGVTWQRTRVSTSFDSGGRPVQVNDHGDTGGGGDERCTRIDYADNTGKWILNTVSRTEAVAVACGTTPERPGDVISDQRTFYDGSSTLGAPPSKGLPSKEQVLDDWDGGPVYATTSEVEYDVLGRVVRATDGLGRTTTTAYTPAGAGPVTAVTVTNPAGHVSVEHWEPAWGKPTALVDPNGRRTDLSYDPLGRLTAVWQPGLDKGTDPAHLRFAYEVRNDAPSAVTTQRVNVSGGYITSVALYDSLLREIQIQADTPLGGRLVTETAYNTRGQVEYESGPNWDETSGPNSSFVRVEQGADHRRTWFTYDSLGRVIRVELWSKNVELWQTTTAYGGSSLGFLTRTTPPAGGTPTGEITNARGETVERRHYHGDTAIGAYDATTYAYDRRGRLATVTDPAGNTWSHEYDLRGRTTAVHDPDSGTTTAGYDSAGQMLASTDARGETLSRVYDQLGRPFQRWHGQVGSGELLVEWTYDTMPGGIGLPATASAYVDGHELRTTVSGYDGAGRPTRTTTTVPSIPGLEQLAGSFWTIQQFNIDGTLAIEALPQVGGLPREAITYTYNDAGLPERMVGELVTTGDTQVYVDSATYTAHGELAQRTLGAFHQNQVYHTYSYADGTRRRQEFRLSRDAVGATNVAHLQYDHDDTGNIVSIADAVQDPPGVPERQCFTYDYLRRLAEAWAQAGTDPCATQPSTQAMGGPAPYWFSHTFDVTGNRTSHTQHDPGGGAQTSSYTYPPGGGPQPHTLSSVTTGGQVDGYSHDVAGNTVARTGSGGTTTIAWDAAGQPTAITDGAGNTTRMIYDPGGSRIARIDGNGDAHLFLAGLEVSYTAATGTTSAVRRYRHNGELVAVRSSTSGLQWLASDHHGTATWAIAASNMAVTHRRQDPYGNPRGPQQTWPAGQQGFVGGIEDPTGLVQIGARSYDPATGRFISSDPITNFADAQQINGYTYSNGNPVSFSDPTGLYPSSCASSRPAVVSGPSACGVRQRGTPSRPEVSCERSRPAVSSPSACGVAQRGTLPPQPEESCEKSRPAVSDPSACQPSREVSPCARSRPADSSPSACRPGRPTPEEGPESPWADSPCAESRPAVSSAVSCMSDPLLGLEVTGPDIDEYGALYQITIVVLAIYLATQCFLGEMPEDPDCSFPFGADDGAATVLVAVANAYCGLDGLPKAGIAAAIAAGGLIAAFGRSRGKGGFGKGIAMTGLAFAAMELYCAIRFPD